MRLYKQAFLPRVLLHLPASEPPSRRPYFTSLLPMQQKVGQHVQLSLLWHPFPLPTALRTRQGRPPPLPLQLLCRRCCLPRLRLGDGIQPTPDRLYSDRSQGCRAIPTEASGGKPSGSRRLQGTHPSTSFPVPCPTGQEIHGQSPLWSSGKRLF